MDREEFGDMKGNSHRRLKFLIKDTPILVIRDGVTCIFVVNKCVVFLFVLSTNVFKNLKTLGSLKCLQWPLSYLVYFTLHYPLGSSVLGTSQPHCLTAQSS